jgi:hypothetical protein
MSSTVRFIGKLSVCVGLTIGVSYYLMKITTPSPEKIVSEFSEGRRKLLKNPSFLEEKMLLKSTLSEHLKKNIDSTQPVWLIQTLTRQEAEKLLHEKNPSSKSP